MTTVCSWRRNTLYSPSQLGWMCCPFCRYCLTCPTCHLCLLLHIPEEQLICSTVRSNCLIVKWPIKASDEAWVPLEDGIRLVFISAIEEVDVVIVRAYCQFGVWRIVSHAFYPFLAWVDCMDDLIQVAAFLKADLSDGDSTYIVGNSQVAKLLIPSNRSWLLIRRFFARGTCTTLSPWLYRGSRSISLTLNRWDYIASLATLFVVHVKHQDLVVITWGYVHVVCLYYAESPHFPIMMRVLNGLFDLFLNIALHNAAVSETN